MSDQTKKRDTDPVTYLGKQSHSGEWVWKNLISKNPQIFLVLSGHFDNAGGQFHQTSLNEQGGSVHELLADYQNHKDGGNAYLRLMRFVPERKVMEVRTYSPVVDQFMTDKASEFVLPWEPKVAASATTKP